MRGRCVTPRWVEKAKASATITGGRSRTDAVRAGSVTQWELRRNLDDRWLPGMSLTTSAGMGAAWPGSARATAINRHPDDSLCPRRPMPATGTWGREGGRGCRRGDGRSDEPTAALQLLMSISYAVFCLKTQ